MDLSSNTTMPMAAKKYLWLERVTSDERPYTMGGLLLVLVVFAHLCLVFWLLTRPELSITQPPKPLKIIEVALVAVARPVITPSAPVVTPVAPPVKPIPPKPVVKPKESVVKEPPKKKLPSPKPVLEPKPEPVLKQTAFTEPAPVLATPEIVAPSVSVKVEAKAAEPVPAKVLEKPAPITGVVEIYCPEAKINSSRHWEGKGLLKLKIAPDGSVEEAIISKSSGHELLDEAAKRAAEKCQFTEGTAGVIRTANKPFGLGLGSTDD